VCQNSGLIPIPIQKNLRVRAFESRTWADLQSGQCSFVADSSTRHGPFTMLRQIDPCRSSYVQEIDEYALGI